MKGIYTAMRSGYWGNQTTVKIRDPVAVLSYAFLNTLSMSALNQRDIDRVIILTDCKDPDVDVITEKIKDDLNIEKHKIQVFPHNNRSNNELNTILREQQFDHATILIGAISKESIFKEVSDSHSNETLLDIVKKQFENGEKYVNQKAYQGEIFPFEVSRGEEQQHLLFDELHDNQTNNVRSVNGVAALLFRANKGFLTHHSIPFVELDHMVFPDGNFYELIHYLKEAELDDSWIVEFDYLSTERFIEVQKKLKTEGLDLPQMKSGGSVFFGNSKVLNGFRAISSAMAQMERDHLRKAIIFVLNDDDSTELIILHYQKEEKYD